MDYPEQERPNFHCACTPVVDLLRFSWYSSFVVNLLFDCKVVCVIGYFALQAAGKLNITDKGVLSSLLRLASDDNSWKVKAHTIKGEKSDPSCSKAE